MSMFYKVGKVLCNIFCALAFNIKISGQENLPKEKGFILASNHITDLDPLFIAIRIKRQLNFMAKSELFKNKIGGAIIKALGAFPVERGTGDTSAIDKAVETVKSGNVFAIFPEGTRSKDGQLKRFKSGTIIVASQTGADIIPTSIYIKDISEGKKIRFRSKVIVKYGKIIPNDELQINLENTSTIKKASMRVREEIANLLEESKNEQ